MESVDEPRDLRYRGILSLMDILHGYEELAQQATIIVSHLKSSLTETNTSKK